MTGNHPILPPPPNRRLTRRDFLGVAGMGALASSLVCVGGGLGYLALNRLTDRETRPTPAASAPAPPVAGPNRLKQIDRPAIIPRAEWGAREVDHTAVNEFDFYSPANTEGWRAYEGDIRDIYRTVVVHHSVEYDVDDPTSMRVIQDLHMDDNGWADIAYHFAVGKAGGVYEGRALNVRGTHVEHFNTGSVGVVFLGNFEVDIPAPEQIDAGLRLIDWLALRLELTHLAGHRDFNDFTECPGANLYPVLEGLALSAGLILGTGGYQPPPEQLITPTPPPA